MFKKKLHKIHLKLSKNRKLVRFFIKLRNQLNSIINYHITNTIEFNKNGENLIANLMAAEANFIVDVGANIGQYTENLLKYTNIDKIKIYLFEPGLKIFKRLEKTFNNNNIILCNAALSDKIGKETFFEIDNYGETSSLHFSTVKDKKTTQYEIKVDTIDNYFKTQDFIDFIKIDTEGNDFFVLKGAENKLKNANIKYIQFEYNTQWLNAGSTLIATIIFLNKYNYDVFLIRPDGLYHFNYELYGDFFHYANFFAVHKNYLKTIQSIIKGAY